MCDACGLTITEPSKSLLETNISFSTPLLQQNHVSPSVENVHWLALKSQVIFVGEIYFLKILNIYCHSS